MATKKFAVVLVEGDTEKCLFNDLKSNLRYPIKRVVVANLWNCDIKRLLPSLTEPSDVLVVFDIDALENIGRFKENINVLKKKNHKVHLFQQNKNFESEISYACSLTVKRLFNLICPKIGSADNFKSEFIKINNRLAKLDSIGFVKSKLWERKLIKGLSDFNLMHSSHEKYFNKK